MNAIFIILFGALFGWGVGNELVVLIYRLPQWLAQQSTAHDELVYSQPILNKPSYRLKHFSRRCTTYHPCLYKHPLQLLRWILVGDHCKNCQVFMQTRYQLIKCLTALTYCICIVRFGLTGFTLWAMGLCGALIVLAGIDGEHQLLPDAITLPLTWAGLLVHLIYHPVLLEQAILGAIAGYVSLWSIFQVHRWKTGREGIGYGDFKLSAALGAWLGWPLLPYLLLAASLLAISRTILQICNKPAQANQTIAFGAYLALMGIVFFLSSTKLFNH